MQANAIQICRSIWGLCLCLWAWNVSMSVLVTTVSHAETAQSIEMPISHDLMVVGPSDEYAWTTHARRYWLSLSLLYLLYKVQVWQQLYIFLSLASGHSSLRLIMFWLICLFVIKINYDSLAHCSNSTTHDFCVLVWKHYNECRVSSSQAMRFLIAALYINQPYIHAIVYHHSFFMVFVTSLAYDHFACRQFNKRIWLSLQLQQPVRPLIKRV